MPTTPTSRRAPRTTPETRREAARVLRAVGAAFDASPGAGYLAGAADALERTAGVTRQPRKESPDA